MVEKKIAVNKVEPVAEAPISEDIKPQEPEKVIVPEEIPPVVTPQAVVPPQAGDKTEPNLLLKSLQEERERRKELEEELAELKKSSALSEEEDEIFSDEGKALKKEISTLTDKINSLDEERNFQMLYTQYPVLQDKVEEFNEFRKDYPKTKLENVAKLYLSENGLLDAPRKGLEKPTGGERVPSFSGMTVEEIKTLRETNFKKYQEMLLKGQIKIEG